MTADATNLTDLSALEMPATRPEFERSLVGDTLVVTTDGRVHLAFDPSESALLEDIDGTRTLPELVERHGLVAEQIVEDLREVGFLVGSRTFREPRLLISGVGVEFDGFDRVVTWIDRVAGRFFGARLLWAVALVIVLVGPVMVQSVSPGPERYSGSLTLGLLVAWDFVAIFAHELAHALVLHRGGRRVGRAGLGFHWGAVTFFVDATDAFFLERGRRIAQALAGPATDALMAGALVLLAGAIGPGPLSALLVQMAILGWISALVNLSPVLGLDGQHVLADLTGRADLHRASLDAVRVLILERRGHAVPLALYGLGALVLGLGAIGLSVHLWTTSYLDLVVESWGQGVVGMAVALVFAGPTVVAVSAAAAHRIRTR